MAIATVRWLNEIVVLYPVGAQLEELILIRTFSNAESEVLRLLQRWGKFSERANKLGKPI